VALLITQIAFASLAVEGKLAMSPRYGVSPTALAMTRILGGAILFGLAARSLKSPRVTSWADRGRLTLLSLFGIVINQALFLTGLRLTSPMSATLLVATIPVFTAIILASASRCSASLRSTASRCRPRAICS
jgi:drug/metabolite transporter (DMT)-like permease